MKKIWIYTLTVLMIVTVTLIPAFAEETEFVTETSAETVSEPSTEAVTEPLTETVTQTAPSPDSALWQDMLTYLAENGVDTGGFSADTVDKLIALGEQFSQLKEEGYTMEERLEQLVTPENILTTASALVLIFSTVFLFIMKNRQRAATLTAAKNMQILKAAYDSESEQNASLREEVSALRQEQVAMADLLRKIAETGNENAQALKTSRDCSVGVANMVKDVFLNSKSLDHAGKDLMIRNYLNATGGTSCEEEREDNA